MPELICEEIAHQAGFSVSVGNWISPNGDLILGTNYDTHHWETLKEYLNFDTDIDNHLKYMNDRVQDGFIRLVFRSDVLFQVACKKKEDIWGEIPNLIKMREILEKISSVEIHIFSRNFYIIGLSRYILRQDMEMLEVKEQC